MSHTPNELAQHFAEDAAVLHRLKIGNARFVELADEHHELNRAIHRIETDVEPASDEHLEGLKRRRLALLDEISSLVAAEKRAVA